ncbi:MULTISPECIES: symmetrical bis(5'-nucleosyl)-tetraphosphatase [Thiorhodovibrio]|uniref:symmetrical bis(5'-nucleosyl)-tetraphosphatase n=1 Tax=Thiorhodovibrio TaxID=61593 RepID=UPI001914577F|nr:MULTISPECIES: symmetrical bis(5'-nucleosyl)-tetraphosphatase [Thiorhodovibrio]MBK5968283.1 bis(5'-nucleosyl)-tetraphosphatase (symmetrical) [Thiorhodovibrio winogradskyi]WPL13013.1 Bis(5'-nucleosyl)-tetraphosphatase, symmetrical [Thiorhodovibrio litoralis]
MATYAIGDIQGCYDELARLLDELAFDPATDRLWSVGDLVNRGPKSLEVLRFFKRLGACSVMVLGNHDLHLLALAAGNQRHANDSTLDAILQAPDRDELLDWLRRRPLFYRSKKKEVALVHAGLPPQWDCTQAQALAGEVEAALCDPGYAEFLQGLYGNEPSRWRDDLRGMDRLRFIVNCLTRLRYCDAEGTLLLKEKGPPGAQSDAALPWFQVPGRRSRDERIIFGHWSTLGYHAEENIWAIDSGCLWGGELTALRVRRKKAIKPIAIDCPGQARPGE